MPPSTSYKLRGDGLPLAIVDGGTNSGTALINNQLMKSSAGAIVEAGALTDGQLFIGSTGAAPVAASLTAGANITITPGAGTITIAASGGGGGVSGSGTATQIAFWSAATTIAGDNDLWWDNTNKRFGVGTSTPTAKINVVETSQILIGSKTMGSFVLTVDPTANSLATFNAGLFNTEVDTANTFNIATLFGLRGGVTHAGTGTLTNVFGSSGLIINSDTGVMTNAAALAASINNTSSGTITNAQGVFVDSPFNASGTITNFHGVYVETPTAATNNYGAYFGANVGINELAPVTALHITGASNDEFIRLGITGDTAGIFAGSADPNGSVTGQRGSIFLRTNGSVYVNTDDAMTWAILSSGGLSGAGVAGQVTFWTGASSLSGDNDLWWDNTNKFLGVNTITPADLVDIEGSTSAGLVVSAHMRLGTNSSLTPVDPNAILFVSEDFATGFQGNFIFQLSTLTPAGGGTDFWVNQDNQVIVADDAVNGFDYVRMYSAYLQNNNTIGGNELTGGFIQVVHQVASTVGTIHGFRVDVNYSGGLGGDVGVVYGITSRNNPPSSNFTGTSYSFHAQSMDDSVGTNYAFFYGDFNDTNPSCIDVDGYIGIKTPNPICPVQIGDPTNPFFFGDDLFQRFHSSVADIGQWTGATNPNGALDITGVAGPGSIYFNATNQNIHVNIDGAQQWAAICPETFETAASANDLVLTSSSRNFSISGVTQINAITIGDYTPGTHITLIFQGALTVKNNTAGGAGTAVIFLAGSVDMTTAANTVLGLVYDGTQFQETFRKGA